MFQSAPGVTGRNSAEEVTSPPALNYPPEGRGLKPEFVYYEMD